MSNFNRMTIVAAVEVIADFHSNSEMAVLEVQWDLNQYGISSTGKSARVADWARIAADSNPQVMTEQGEVLLERALVDAAIRAPERTRQKPKWKKLVAGLRFDGFEVDEPQIEPEANLPWSMPQSEAVAKLVRMLPTDIPEIDFREAGSEVELLLEQFNFSVARGHLQRALSAFQRGEWSSANGELRNFYEDYLNEIANGLGYTGPDNSKARRDFLGAELTPPFFIEEYNEWHPQRTQFVQGLMNRMHPHGGHPGLSEEEDATFRLQIMLVTARLFLRRFDQRSA